MPDIWPDRGDLLELADCVHYSYAICNNSILESKQVKKSRLERDVNVS